MNINEGEFSLTLKELNLYLNNFLVNKELCKHQDVLNDIKNMNRSISNILSFIKICKFAEYNDSDSMSSFNIRDVDTNDMEPIIQYFKNAFNQAKKIDAKLSEDFSKLFNLIKYEKKSHLVLRK